jgi:tetratricopeptide (TPR) repeat protein
MGRSLEAEAAYRTAVKADPRFAQAWYNLADLLDVQRRTKEAIACLDRALEADPGCADAMFNMALLLQGIERHAEAAQWWRRYLSVDASSPWAARARRAMKYCEIQLAPTRPSAAGGGGAPSKSPPQTGEVLSIDPPLLAGKGREGA